MKFNLKNIWVLILVTALGYISYVLGKCGVTQTCENYEIFGRYSFSVFEPILLYSMAVSPLAIAVLFASNHAFRKWLTFSARWLPLSVLLIALAKTNSNSWMPLYPEATKENVAWLMGGLFTVISLVIMVRANRTSRTKAS